MNPKYYTTLRTELGSHANIIITGANVEIFDNTGKTCTVNSLLESAGRLENAWIVNAVMAYDYSY